MEGQQCQARPFTGLYEALGFLNAILISVTFSSQERRGTTRPGRFPFSLPWNFGNEMETLPRAPPWNLSDFQGRRPAPPQDCTSRQQELTGVVEEVCWKFDPAAGSFKKGATGEILADNTSDLRWKMCQDRRGLAYDQVALLSNEVHARWVALMIKHKHRVPPPRYERVSWNQLFDADNELFTLAAQTAKGGIRPDSSGVKPLDAIFERLMLDNRVTFFLMPMPLGAPMRDTPGDAADRNAKKHETDVSHNAIMDWQGGSHSGQGNKKGGKGKGGKGKGSSSSSQSRGGNKRGPNNGRTLRGGPRRTIDYHYHGQGNLPRLQLFKWMQPWLGSQGSCTLPERAPLVFST